MVQTDLDQFDKRYNSGKHHLDPHNFEATSINDYIAYLSKSEKAVADAMVGQYEGAASKTTLRTYFAAKGVFMHAEVQHKINILTFIRDYFSDVKTIKDALEKVRAAQVPEEQVSKWIRSQGLFQGLASAIWQGYENLRVPLADAYYDKLEREGVINKQLIDRVRGIPGSKSRIELPIDIPANNEIDITKIGDYKTLDGSPITLKLLRRDPTDLQGGSDGWMVNRVTAFVGGKEVGYLKVAYIPQEAFDLLYPTIWHYVERNEGIRLLTEPTDLDGVWRTFNCNKEIRHRRILPTKEVRDQNLAKIAEQYQTKYEQFIARLVDRPLVDYLHVERGVQQKAPIQIALVDSAARWLGRLGLKLHSNAENNTMLWEYFSADRSVPFNTKFNDELQDQENWLDYTE